MLSVKASGSLFTCNLMAPGLHPATEHHGGIFMTRPHVGPSSRRSAPDGLSPIELQTDRRTKEVPGSTMPQQHALPHDHQCCTYDAASCARHKFSATPNA